MHFNIKLLIPSVLVFIHYVGFPCFDVFLQNCTKGRYTPMSFGCNVRCYTVVESYIVFYTNIELFIYVEVGVGKNRGAKAILN